MSTFTPAELIAELCKLHNRDRWPRATIGIGDGPLRRALVKAGYLETGAASPNNKARHWVLTAAGREVLIDYPGSGIYRSKPR